MLTRAKVFSVTMAALLVLTVALGTPATATPPSANPARPQFSTTDAQNVEFVGHIGGATYAVAVQGDYVYIGEGPRLTILDISTPASPTVAGKTPLLSDTVRGIYVAGGYAYVADGRSGLRVVDVSTPSNPTEVGFCGTLWDARSVAVSGGYAYVTDFWHGLRVVDVSTPSNPTEVGSYEVAVFAGGVAVVGAYVYIGDGDNGGLRVVDISTPSNPTEVGYHPMPGTARGMFVAGSHAYVAAGSSLRVLDVSNPANPTEVGDYDTSDAAYDIAVAGNYAYVAGDPGLWVVDVSNPTNPTGVGFHDVPGDAESVAVVGGYAYVAGAPVWSSWHLLASGLRVVDVSTPSNPTEVGSYEPPVYAGEVDVAGGYAYVAGGLGLWVVDVSTPPNPTEVGFCETPGDARGVAVVGDYAYVADYDGGLRVVDISNPANPTEVGDYDTDDAYDVAVAGNYAYAAAGGLRVVDISDPSNPTEVGSYDTPGYAEGVAVAGGYAYVADYPVGWSWWGGGLRVVDVSDPSNPTGVGSYDYDRTEEAYRVDVAGGYAYVASGWDGLRVVDISNPAGPTEVGSYNKTPLLGQVKGVAVAGTYVYVVNDRVGLWVVDVSDPSNPTEVGSYPLPVDSRSMTAAESVTVAGGYIYVAGRTGGLYVLRYTGEDTGLTSDVLDFVTDSNQRILDVSSAAADVSDVGDYFLDKQDADEARLVVNLALNTWSLVGIDWGLVGQGLNNIATPGYQAALHASWRGWVDDRVAKHWYKPLYDAIYNDRELVFDEVAWAGLKYYAKDTGETALKGPIKDWLLNELVPGSDLPFFYLFGDPAIRLGHSYRTELLREQGELLTDLAGLGLTPAQEADYRADMLARQQAHAQIVAQLESHRNLLWNTYQDSLADEAKWWKFWGPLLIKWVVIGGATLAWDGPGYYVASAGSAVYSTIHHALKDTRARKHDGKMLDQSMRFLAGRVSSAYSQIALNSVGALNMIRAGDSPQVASGDTGTVAMKSLGHYRLWPHLWWAEESSQVELPISNNSAFTVAYLTSAAYTHTGWGIGAERLWPEGESLQLAVGEQDTAVIKFKSEDDGVSPDKASTVDLLVLGATETGIYPVASTQVSWSPTRIETLIGAKAQAPAGYTAAEAADAPALPYPLSSLVSTPPGSTDHQVTIAVVNPFTLTVSATVTQTIPANFTILDAGDGLVVGSALVWTDVISVGEGLEMQALLGWEGTPGESVTMPGPELAFQDPNTGQGDTYTAPDEAVPAAWPLETSADIPLSWESGVTTIIPVTLTNLSSNVTAQGVFTCTMSKADGTLLWTSTLPVNVAPQGAQLLSLPVHVTTGEDYAVLYGQVALGSVHKSVFLEIVSVEGDQIYLPLILRDY